jgi:hypothetical protein
VRMAREQHYQSLEQTAKGFLHLAKDAMALL